MKFTRILGIVIILIISGSFSFQKIDYRNAMHKNVCKSLRNNALVFIIFVDNKTTTPWTEFDIRSTMDSVAVVRKWLMDQAKKYSVPLNVQTDYYIGKDFTTISKNLPGGSVYKTATTPNFKKGLLELNAWSDWIARKAGTSMDILQKDGIREIKNPRNKERLVAYLRDTYKVESVALLFMVNNYFKNDISLQMNTMNTDDIEFSIVSYKYPAEIAHNILHLYGAADLHKSLYRRHDKKIKQLSVLFPNEIMQDPYAKNIWAMEISEYSRYLIGWQETVDPQLEELFIDKNINY